MSKYPSIILHRSKVHAVKRFHPWVFSGAVKRFDKGLQGGDVVEIHSEDGEYLGIGHYGAGSVSARIFSFSREEDLMELWVRRLQSAYNVRKAAGLAESEHTNAYRLSFGEGDGLPGMVIDWYNGTAVIQAHSTGMYRERENFAAALKQVYGDKLKAVYDKSGEALRKADEEVAAHEGGYLYGKPETDLIKENNHQFKVNWETGQKTGFFIDQRDNRELLGKYAKGKKVLNTFCYSGGFSVYALHNDAALVHSVDSSAKAIDWTNENVALNKNADRHQAYVADVFDFMKNADADYDIIVLDPPAFAKSQNARHTAIKAYKRLNMAAIQKIKSGGIIFTFSCSQVVDTEMFTGAVTSAAIECGKKVRVLHRLSQPADHPVSIFNPEALYLKGLVLYIE